MDLYLIFQFVKGRCRGNQIMLPNEGELILCAFFARSPDGRLVLFHYYLLGRDTAAPSGLYARLCHAFLVFAVLLSITIHFIALRLGRQLCISILKF